MHVSHQPGRLLGRTRLAGSTLVEVMLAAMLLSVMVIGSGAYVYYARGGTYREARRRVALEVAGSRLEHLRASYYADLRPDTTARRYVSFSSGAWTLHVSDPGDILTIGSQAYPTVTTVTRVDGSNPNREVLQTVVRVSYLPDADAFVELATLLAE